ncbi:ATP(GTP)-binding protein Fet5 [Cryptococcus gattii Ru294]|uniref:GPN-loop GTPase 3 n=2 Tax=Cryptococcus gattii TaxID=37769 RepID=E6QZ65_CRYGW|nr:ATP(GTP)-binding protein Fet5, putative [Cryptococcus gattii WM276]KIR54178.1 ATP(GTP)-binding protein Fet5 [Cryptococcus gattii Ru294]KIR79975.1 ATP(GTP)-binding protein Fet5 [Cryptococcus gattii EJB2]KIY34383.1 ATP(GTP)-binding protein Fet5 [Cryptococcus gattii E566]KJE05258.1 ATP(GTP)-binding protein Fet5 [Cryptococcus gattii NT-10]ADV19443.1 ATP(GTP)-binding protein Fet5, putative [Cryptococcus gattii WM276]
MRYAVLVTGPAGAGKSTFCASLITHAQTIGRSVHLVNLDPAADKFEYEPTIDIRDLINLEDVMEELEFGPNGGLIYCFEYLLNNLDWLEDELGAYEDDYLIIDCPGQIELYTHVPLLPRLTTFLSTSLNFRTSAVYLIDSQFMQDKSKFFAGVMSAMSCMLSLGISMLCLMSKMDLVKDKKGRTRREVGRYLDPDPNLLLEDINQSTNPKFNQLNRAVVSLIEDQNIVSFLPLDVTSEDSVNTVLSHIDNMMQYGEDEEPKVPKDMDDGEFVLSLGSYKTGLIVLAGDFD